MEGFGFLTLSHWFSEDLLSLSCEPPRDYCRSLSPRTWLLVRQELQGKRVSWPYSQFKVVISRCPCTWARDRLIDFALSPLSKLAPSNSAECIAVRMCSYPCVAFAYFKTDFNIVTISQLFL